MLSNTITALITPFKQNKEIDLVCFSSLVERQVTSGIDALVLFGTTGESPTLSEEEKFLLLETALEVSKGRSQIIVGTGDPCTSKAFALTKKCKEIGANGALIISPYYNRPTENGIILHMKEIAKAGLPMIFYYHPGRCGQKLSPLCIKEVMEIDEVVALKDCSGEKAILDRVRKLIYCGNDRQILQMAEMGVEGSISVISNIFPATWKKIVSTKDKELFAVLDSFLEIIDREVNPQPIKALSSLLGLNENILRLPLTSSEKHITDALQDRLLLLFQEERLLCEENGLPAQDTNLLNSQL
jgi:4-hydroxy-tetrahydrodipicolinate synthase